MTDRAVPKTIDDYIAACPPEVRPILENVRSMIRAAAPDARERIGYQMPAFALNGDLIYFAAFKKHLGIYPPVTGDTALQEAIAPFRGEKGNLKFPFDEPIPYDLISKVIEFRVQEHLATRAAKRKDR